jgi:murein DD-endopeptidase MepM/ murein hydrolase activator NlpD
MENQVEIIFISKKRNFLRQLRIPLPFVIASVGMLIFLTIAAVTLSINSTRETFTRIRRSKVEDENRGLVAKLDSLSLTLKCARGLFDEHVGQDNRERTYWQMAHIHPDIWSMGIGGKKVERSPHIMNKNLERTINEIHESIDVLKGKYYLRQTSLREIESRIGESEYLWSHIPSIHPLPGRRICSGYGYRVDPIDRKVRMHWGMDIGAPRGTKILVTADGVVDFAGWVNGYGWTVVVDHGFGFKTAYAHCQRILVKRRELVKRGQAIARVGSTGRSISPHLHYEVRVSGMKINPYKYINTSSVIFD